MSQTPITLLTDTFTRTNSATVGNGWVDSNSGFSIASNKLSVITSGGYSNVYRLTRPNDGIFLNQQVSIDLPNMMISANGQTVSIYLRDSGAGTTCYLCQMIPDTLTTVKLKFQPVVAGTNVGGGFVTPTVNTANPCRLTASVIGNTITMVLTDLSTNTVIYTFVQSDTNSNLSGTGQVAIALTPNKVAMTVNQVVISDPKGIDLHALSSAPPSAPRQDLSFFGAPVARTRCNYGPYSDQLVQMVRTEHVALVDLNGIVIGHSGWYICPDKPCDNAFTVKSSLEYPLLGADQVIVGFTGLGPLIPAYTSEGRAMVVQPGQVRKFDPIYVKIKAGDYFATRHQVSVTTGQTYPSGLVVGEGYQGRCQNPVSDMTVSYTDSGGSTFSSPVTAPGYNPAFIGGIPGSPLPSVIGLIGTSISEGAGQGSFLSWAHKAFSGNHVLLNMAKGGTSLAIDQTDYYFAQRRYRLGLLAGCHHLIIEHFVNEPEPLPHIQANLLSLANDAAAMGVKVWVCTATSRTTSTDSFATIANQTVGLPFYAPGGARDQFNTFINAQAATPGSPIYGVIDTAGQVIDAATGKWKVGMVADGVHPNDAGHTAMATAVNLALFNAPSTAVVRQTI